VVEEDAFVPGLVVDLAERVVGGGVVAGAAGDLALGIFFGGALGAAVDVKPDVVAAGVDVLLGEAGNVERVNGVSAGGIADLPDDGGELVVGGFIRRGEGVAAVVVVEDLE